MCNSDISTDGQMLLALDGVSVCFEQGGKRLPAVTDLSFTVPSGTIVALVGESGCGKSLTARAIMALPPPGAHVSGKIFFFGENILERSKREMRALRGRHISMIFQEPQTALNPVLTVGRQATEVLEAHFSLAAAEMRARVEELFTQVGIPNAHSRFSSYPHELSGGMRQRVLIAMSLLANPELLLADEPTTALDTTIRQQILRLLYEQSQARGMAVLCISHDLDLVRSFAAEVGVMYAGHLVEYAQVEELFAHPLHPYTQGLLAATPKAVTTHTKRLPTIPGVVPPLTAMPPGCPFAPRCDRATHVCQESFPLQRGAAQHIVFCHRAG